MAKKRCPTCGRDPGVKSADELKLALGRAIQQSVKVHGELRERREKLRKAFKEGDAVELTAAVAEYLYPDGGTLAARPRTVRRYQRCGFAVRAGAFCTREVGHQGPCAALPPDYPGPG